jgi:hypothetical protein
LPHFNEWWNCNMSVTSLTLSWWSEKIFWVWNFHIINNLEHILSIDWILHYVEEERAVALRTCCLWSSGV